MLRYENALQILMDAVPRPKVATVPLPDALGRVLAEDVTADMDLPPFDKSFMDGFALRASDVAEVPARLKVVGLQAAGRAARGIRLGPGQALQIMTGAPIPSGADAVQMVEKTRRLSDGVEILEPVTPGTHVAPRGAEVLSGEVVLTAGQFVGSAQIAVLATFGRSFVRVYRAPSASVFATGDELTGVEEKPSFGQIRNSNGPMLEAQCRRLGISATLMPVVPDRPQAARRAIREALEDDVIILSGGVSAGEFDYVHQVIESAGLELLFHKVAIKPGKPILAASGLGKLVFGLPGNPVSSLVTFEMFVRPAVRKWMGFRRFGLPRVTGRLLRTVRQKPGRLFFKPAQTRISTGREILIEPLETRGSADMVGFSRANSLLPMAVDIEELEEESKVEVLLLPDHSQLMEPKNEV